MKIVVFGPFKRTGVLRDETVVDLSYAYAKYLRERTNEPYPLEMADVVVPSDLACLIESGSRTLDAVQISLDYLFGQAQDRLGPRGETLVHRAAEVRLHAPRPNNARIACAGGNFADHAAAMAARMRGRPYEGDAYQEIRNSGFWGFWKLGREIVGPDGELVYPGRCNRLDYEGEIAIILGKRGVDLKPSQLKEYIWGVTMLADWSIRAPREAPGGPLNFNFPKNFDTSCSMGPCIAVGEIDHPPMSIWRRWSTGSVGSGSTRATWYSPLVNISNICHVTSRSIRVTSSAAEQRRARRRIRVICCRIRPPRQSAS
jgi:2-keto-4-pentenoate hydratase/2-oxohepta-3-ene-1,7-dioic acid hydratase in catechol pathway